MIVKKGGKLNVGKRCSITGCIIQVSPTCSLSIAEDTIIRKSRFSVINKNSSLQIGKHNSITHSQIVVSGKLYIGDENILDKGYSYRNYSIRTDGNISIR